MSAKILDEPISAALPRLVGARQDDVAQPRHFVGAEGDRPLGAHLHAGPAILVVGGRHHGDRRNIERELREIGHRRHREPDVMHRAARRHQALRQRDLDRHGIGAEIMARHDLAA